tara:strand:+ start:429 stop:578 length:150 start_codon:yes stop_codon:yes gene_type:complete
MRSSQAGQRDTGGSVLAVSHPLIKIVIASASELVTAAARTVERIAVPLK